MTSRGDNAEPLSGAEVRSGLEQNKDNYEEVEMDIDSDPESTGMF